MNVQNKIRKYDAIVLLVKIIKMFVSVGVVCIYFDVHKSVFPYF